MIVQWMSLLGVAGFLCGFIGPMLLAPEANQGPMLGIFITGPGGAIAGLLLGSIAAMLQWPVPRQKQCLQYCTIVLASVTLYFCIPTPRYQADVVDGAITACTPVDALREKTVDSLNTLHAQRPVPKPIPWGEKFDQAASAKPGVVIAVRLSRVTQFFEKQARWNRGDLMMKPWVTSDKEAKYFANYLGSSCAPYPLGTQTVLTATGNIGIWPPYGIAEMLNLKTAEPLSPKHMRLLASQQASH